MGGDNRAVSPVVGGILLIGILVVLVTITAALIFGATDNPDPAPEVAFELRETDDRFRYALVHESGDRLDGDRVELRGVANPDSPAGTTVTAGDEMSFYPTSDRVTVVWYGDRDTSYVLTRADVEVTLPAPDEGCDWVDDQTNGGTDPITIDGIVVDCDVETDEQVTVRNGGVVIGDVDSGLKEFDGDSARVYGDVDVENVANLQDGTVAGDIDSGTADVKAGNATVGGSIDAEKVAEATDGSVVEGDMESRTKDTKVLDSEVEGSVTAAGIVKVQDARIDGHVYVDPSDFDCTNSTISGEGCGSYTPKDPSTW